MKSSLILFTARCDCTYRADGSIHPCRDARQLQREEDFVREEYLKAYQEFHDAQRCKHTHD